jgi:hypothetical protein
VSDIVVCSQHLSSSDRVLAAMGKNELLATTDVDVIDVDCFIGKVQRCIPFFWFPLSVCSIALSNALFFDPRTPMHRYIGYDMPFWRWTADTKHKKLEACSVFVFQGPTLTAIL